DCCPWPTRTSTMFPPPSSQAQGILSNCKRHVDDGAQRPAGFGEYGPAECTPQLMILLGVGDGDEMGFARLLGHVGGVLRAARESHLVYGARGGNRTPTPCGTRF